MENKFLIDLAIQHGLTSEQTTKISDMVYQAGVNDVESDKGKAIANFICQGNLVDRPAEEIIEELKRAGHIS